MMGLIKDIKQRKTPFLGLSFKLDIDMRKVKWCNCLFSDPEVMTKCNVLARCKVIRTVMPPSDQVFSWSGAVKIPNPPPG